MNTSDWFATHWQGTARDAERLKRWSSSWDLWRQDYLENQPERESTAKTFLSHLERQENAPPAKPRPAPKTLFMRTAAPPQTMAAAAKVISFPGASPSLKAGEVRVLPSLTALGHDAGQEVLLLRQEDDSSFWWVLPFSPLEHPATDEEWQLPAGEEALEERGCRVLCYWNAFPLSEKLLRRADLLITLPTEVITQVEDLWEIYQATGALPIKAETGASTLGLLDEDDPRAEYVAHCRAECRPWQSWVPLPKSLQAKSSAQALLTAARQIGGAASSANLAIDDSTDLLHLQLQGSLLTIEFRDAHGAISEIWDGCLLLASDAWATVFRRGQVRAELHRLRDGFVIVDPRGEVVPILEAELGGPDEP